MGRTLPKRGSSLLISIEDAPPGRHIDMYSSTRAKQDVMALGTDAGYGGGKEDRIRHIPSFAFLHNHPR
jgi:hypothetical protein